jgi:hypothetical protein
VFGFREKLFGPKYRAAKEECCWRMTLAYAETQKRLQKELLSPIEVVGAGPSLGSKWLN